METPPHVDMAQLVLFLMLGSNMQGSFARLDQVKAMGKDPRRQCTHLMHKARYPPHLLPVALLPVDGNGARDGRAALGMPGQHIQEGGLAGP